MPKLLVDVQMKGQRRPGRGATVVVVTLSS
jgi:hypothetical protein